MPGGVIRAGGVMRACVGVRWDQGSLYFCSEWSWAWTWYCWEEAGDDEGNEAKYRETEEEANPSTVSKTKSTNE